MNARSVHTGMTTLKHSGRAFIWTNGHTYNMIDLSLVNARWMLDMPILEVMIMDSGCSGYSPLSISLSQEVVRRAWQRRQKIGIMKEVWDKRQL